jgi:hypothetical protein
MGLYEVVDQIVELLQRRGRLTYRVVKLQFKLETVNTYFSLRYVTRPSR